MYQIIANHNILLYLSNLFNIPLTLTHVCLLKIALFQAYIMPMNLIFKSLNRPLIELENWPKRLIRSYGSHGPKSQLVWSTRSTHKVCMISHARVPHTAYPHDRVLHTAICSTRPYDVGQFQKQPLFHEFIVFQEIKQVRITHLLLFLIIHTTKHSRILHSIIKLYRLTIMN